jgi:hypothetical protein
MTPAPTGRRSPVIVGDAMSGGDYNNFPTDGDLAEFLDFNSNSPDTLQTMETLGGSDTKGFLAPQDLTSKQLSPTLRTAPPIKIRRLNRLLLNAPPVGHLPRRL